MCEVTHARSKSSQATELKIISKRVRNDITCVTRGEYEGGGGVMNWGGGGGGSGYMWHEAEWGWWSGGGSEGKRVTGG